MSGYDLMKIIKDQFPDMKIIQRVGYADLFEEKARA